ncbi:monocarboxylate transporter 12-like isoform X2 [Acanthaster planci]|nr:monocarboxylate transporter 12-like isoform X2 [Acanthaster planci]
MMREKCSTRCLQGFYIVVCMHISMMLLSGFTKGLGVMLATLREEFIADTWMIGSLIAGMNAVAGFAGPISGPLHGSFGTRTVVVISGLLSGASVILSSFSTSVFHVALTLSLLTGPGLSIISILTRAMAGRHFTTGYAIATGIGSSGHAVGLVVVGPLTQVLLDTYGWRGALLLLGAISLHLGAFGFLLRSAPESTQKENEYLPLVSTEEEEPAADQSRIPNGEKKSRFHIKKDAIIARLNLLGWTICCCAKFWIAFPVFGCDYITCDLWLMYFVVYAETKGFSGYEAVTFTLAGGIGNIVFKIVLGLILDRGLLNLRLSLFSTIIASSLGLLTLPWINTYWMMMVNAFLFQGLSGMTATMSDIYTRDLFGAEDLVPAFSWIGVFTAALALAFGFFPGKPRLYFKNAC